MYNRRGQIRVDFVAIHRFCPCFSSRAVTNGVSNDIWLNRSQRFDKLVKADLCITIQVKSPHYGNELLFHWAMANFFQETSECLLIDVSEIQGINRFKCSSDAEFLKLFKILFELFEFQLKINFLRQKNSHFPLNKVVQSLIV